jgi:hypothetical protein
MKYFFVIVTSFAFCTLRISAQDVQIISAKIVDDKSKNPVPFVNIKIKGKNAGVVSNTDGDFQIPIQYVSDTIVISCIGYLNKVVSLAGLSRDHINVIALAESDYQLKEVEVVSERKRRKILASTIVQRAIDKIVNNCSQKPYNYVAYYRDYQIMRDRYVNLNEAIVKITDAGFQTPDFKTTQIQLYQYKKNYDFQQDTTAAREYDNKKAKYVPHANIFSFGGNELSILRVHDAIRNYNVQSYSYVDVFKTGFIRNHYFRYEKPAYLDSVLLYCISFESRLSASGPLHVARGKIYIEGLSYAIHKIEYANYYKEKGKEELLYNIQLEYSRVDSLMYLNYISFNNQFRTKYVIDDKQSYREFYKSVLQYRELFVQKVNVDEYAGEELIFIDKTQPLSKNQSATKKKASTLYWMNTPLRKD